MNIQHTPVVDRLRVQVAVAENWKSALLEVIDADQLPVHWGGTATDDDGDPYCRSQVGGVCIRCAMLSLGCVVVCCVLAFLHGRYTTAYYPPRWA